MARHADVSISSVSRHLQGMRVRAADVIESSIEELGFRPSSLARSLKSGLTYTIGLVIPDVANPFFAAVAKGAESVAQEAGYMVVVTNADEDSAREEAAVVALSDRIDGLLFTPARDEHNTAELVRRLDIPVVMVDRSIDDLGDVDAVLIDNVAGASAAARHLLELGHRRIGLISGPLATTPGRERRQGFLDECSEHPEVELLVEVGDFKEESGYQSTLRLLGRPNPPTAVFVANNLMTVGALQASKDLGIRIPDALSIIGFDDHSFADLLEPPLTVIDRPTEIQGAIATRLLLARMSGDGSRTGRAIRLEPKLIVRSSTKALEGPNA